MSFDKDMKMHTEKYAMFDDEVRPIAPTQLL
jgi:hypothetical protein